MGRDTKRHRKYHKSEPKANAFRKGQQPPEINMGDETNRFSILCPACKAGHNCKGQGGNARCFHCGNCGFVECEYSEPGYEWDQDNAKPTAERCQCEYCKDHPSGCDCETCVALHQQS